MAKPVHLLFVFCLGIGLGGMWFPVEQATAQDDQISAILKAIEQRCEIEVPIEIGVSVSIERQFLRRNETGYGVAEGTSYGYLIC